MLDAEAIGEKVTSAINEVQAIVERAEAAVASYDKGEVISSALSDIRDAANSALNTLKEIVKGPEGEPVPDTGADTGATPAQPGEVAEGGEQG